MTECEFKKGVEFYGQVGMRHWGWWWWWVWIDGMDGWMDCVITVMGGWTDGMDGRRKGLTIDHSRSPPFIVQTHRYPSIRPFARDSSGSYAPPALFQSAFVVGAGEANASSWHQWLRHSCRRSRSSSRYNNNNNNNNKTHNSCLRARKLQRTLNSAVSLVKDPTQPSSLQKNEAHHANSP